MTAIRDSISSDSGKDISGGVKSKVAIVRCNEYDPRMLYEAISKAVGLIGGFSRFINRGDKVLLKPNLLSARLPETGVDTHPEVVRAVIRLTREAGAIISVGDSPGGCAKVERVYELSGIKKICDEESVRLVKFDNVINKNGVPVAREALEADKIISIPKLKTHGLTMLTGAVKNIFGLVPGVFKTKCHLRHPRVEDFAKSLIDLFSFLRPSLSIMDGIVAMEGDGPTSGDLKKMGIIVASSDSVALDSVVSSIIGIDPFDVPTTLEANKRGLGEAQLERIEVLGESLESVKVTGFKLPRTLIYTRFPAPLLNLLKQLLRFRPKINSKKCQQCNLCLDSCPAKAIEEHSSRYRIDYKKCILCLCCNEVCPHQAVFISKSMLAKVFRM